MRSTIVALTGAGQHPAPGGWYPTGGGWPAAQAGGRPEVLTMPAMAHNHVRPEGGAMPRLDDTAVAEGLQHLPGWQRRGNQIVKTFTREDFAHAMVFVNEVAGAAEAAGHHPNIDIRWNKVTLALSLATPKVASPTATSSSPP